MCISIVIYDFEKYIYAPNNFLKIQLKNDLKELKGVENVLRSALSLERVGQLRGLSAPVSQPYSKVNSKVRIKV